MGALFFAPDVRPPSVLWMRRMLAGLGSDVARLITEVPLGPDWQARYRCAAVPRGAGSLARGALRRLGVVSRRVASPAQATWLAAQANAPEVQSVLVHYVTLALMYERAWRQTDRPVFVHCHGYDVTWDLRSESQPDRHAHPADYPERVLQLAQRVQFIANSQLTAARLRLLGVPEDRIHVKYLGVPVPHSFPRANTADTSPTETQILYLGRLIDFKGPDLTIQAFTRACEQGLKGRLILAGDGPLRSECERLRATSQFAARIELLGAVTAEQAASLRAEADIFTAHNCLGPRTRQEEAYGVSIVEAMADGLPIVSGANASLPELVDDGIHGLLFTPGDIPAHAAALLRLAGDATLREQLGRNAWQRASERFTLEQEMQTLRALLHLPPRQESAA